MDGEDGVRNQNGIELTDILMESGNQSILSRDAFTFLVIFLIVYLDHYNRNTLFQGTPSSSISNLNSAFTFVLGFKWLWTVVLLHLFALGIRKGLLINDDDDDPVVLLWNCGRNVTMERMESDSLQCSAMYPSRTLSSILRTLSWFFRSSFLLFPDGLAQSCFLEQFCHVMIFLLLGLFVCLFCRSMNFSFGVGYSISWLLGRVLR